MIDHAATARAMSPEDFELLLRAYVQEQMHRVGRKIGIVMLTIAPNYGEAEINKCDWSIGYSGETQTKGEILSEVVSEHIRRCRFTSTLRLLEGKVASPEEPMYEQCLATSQKDDEISF